MFESHREKLAPRRRSVRRQIIGALVGFGVLVIALGIGIAGHHCIARLGWVDSLSSDAAKIFASAYALLSGVVFISAMAVMLTPAVHRALHKFHVDGGGGRD